MEKKLLQPSYCFVIQEEKTTHDEAQTLQSESRVHIHT